MRWPPGGMRPAGPWPTLTPFCYFRRAPAGRRPHVTPLVAVWFQGALYFSTGPAEQKAVNLRSHPQVILMAGSGRWEEGLDVVVEGDAVQVTDDAVLRSLAQAWTEKWDGRWQF